MNQITLLDPTLLARRLEREKLARVAAEQMLEDKSRALYKSNQSLEAQKNQLATIFDKTRAGILLIDPDGVVQQANRGALHMFRRETTEIEALLIWDLISHVSHAQVRDYLLKAGFHADEDGSIEIDGMRPDGQAFPMEVGVSQVVQDDDIWTVWICRNLSRAKRHEAERLALERELSQANKLEALGTLASGIAHEINTPVQYVSDNAHFLTDAFADVSELLKAYQTAAKTLADTSALETCANEIDWPYLREEIPSALEQMLGGLQQISNIISAVKIFSHPGSEEKTAFNLNEMIETTMTVSRNQWKYVAKLNTDFDPFLPPIPCYPGELSQVLLNLIVNAAHAIEEAVGEGMQGDIQVTTRASGNRAIIEIKDSGCGIPPENLNKIFDPFFTTKDVGKGTGQGLSLAHAIITQKHGGEISCQSEPGVGTVFTIALPLSSSETGEAS